MIMNILENPSSGLFTYVSVIQGMHMKLHAWRFKTSHDAILET